TTLRRWGPAASPTPSSRNSRAEPDPDCGVPFKTREACAEASLKAASIRRARGMMPVIDIDALLRTLAAKGGSDLHLKVGAPPMIRVDGVLKRLQADRLSPTDTAEVAKKVMPGTRGE